MKCRPACSGEMFGYVRMQDNSDFDRIILLPIIKYSLNSLWRIIKENIFLIWSKLYFRVLATYFVEKQHYVGRDLAHSVALLL